jgi:glycosyltransferase involved in cell wall biosynthesis
MKVLMLSPFPPDKCGIAIYSNNLLKELNKKIRIIKIGNYDSEAKYRINFKSFSLKRKISEIINKEKAKLLFIQYNPAFFGKYNFNLNFLMALKQKIPVIVRLHEVHYKAKNIKDRILMWLEKQIIKKATKVVVHTPQQKGFIEKRYKAKNIECVYHGLETYAINKKKKKTILSFGIISEQKGLKYLIRAMNFLPDYKLIIIGRVLGKKLEKSLMKEIASCKNKKIFYKFSWVSDKERWKSYRKASIVALPHVWAPYQSGILHNAMSCGLPVVVTRVGSLYEMVEIFGVGEIVPPRSPAALADGIKRVFNNYSKYRKNIMRYRKAASWRKVAGEHIKIFNKAL